MRPLAVAALLAALVAEPAGAAGPVFPPGAAAGLVPPAGMSVVPGVSAFQDREKRARILIIDLPREAYGVLEREMTGESLAAKGLTEMTRETPALASGPAFLVSGRQTAGTESIGKWILVARGAVSTAMVTAEVPAASAEAYPPPAIRSALLSLAFKAPPPIGQQLDALPFAVGDLGGFKPVRTLGTALYLSAGTGDDNGAKEALVVIGRAGGVPDSDKMDLFARRLLSSLPTVKTLRVERSEPLRVRGMPGHEIRASAADAATGAPVKVVQWLRVERGSYVRVVAVTPEAEFDALMPRLRAVRDGIEIK
jgi:hypothetical protein